MAKLTTEQKEANKIAFKARNSAFRARRNEYRAEIEAVEKSVEASREHEDWVLAQSNFQRDIDARRQALDEVDRQLNELQRLREATEASHRVLLDESRNAKMKALKDRNDLKHKLKAAVDEKFQDVANCYSAPEWESRTGGKK